MAADVVGGMAGKFAQEWLQFLSAERAVQAYTEYVGVGNRGKESFYGLAGKCAPCLI